MGKREQASIERGNQAPPRNIAGGGNKGPSDWVKRRARQHAVGVAFSQQDRSGGGFACGGA